MTPLSALITVHGTRTREGRATPRGATRWDPAAYERAVKMTFDRVISNDVGRIIVKNIRRRTRIVPWQDMSASGNTTPPRSTARDGSPRGERLASCRELPRTCADPSFEGTGRGSTAIIEITPAAWPDVPGGPGPDEVLVHELVHACQITQGVLSRRPAGHGYARFSEFCAIVGENMYRSARSGAAAFLRASHRPADQARPPDDLMYFYGPSLRDLDEWEMLDRLRTLQQSLARPLEELSPQLCPYNPFRRQREGQRLLTLSSVGSHGPPRRHSR
jgi:hypothetical protein